MTPKDSSFLERLLGIFTPSNDPTPPTPVGISPRSKTVNMSIMAPSELRHTPALAQDGQNDPEVVINGAFVRNFVGETADMTRHNSLAHEDMLAMTPELGRTEQILISSIMSPNDMQTGALSYKVGDVPGFEQFMTQDKKDDVAKFITTFMNKDLQIGPRTQRWLSQALFRAGAAPILVNPNSAIKALNEKLDKLYPINAVGNNPKLKTTLATEGLFSQAMMGETAGFGLESVMPTPTNPNVFRLSDDVAAGVGMTLAGMEGLDISNKAQAEKLPDLAKSLNAHMKTLFMADENTSRLCFSHNPALIGFSESRLAHGKQEVTRKSKNFLGLDGDTVFMIRDEDDDETEYPGIIELPTDSVVPVMVPGAPDKHIGYFVLVDRLGTPLSFTTGNIHSTLSGYTKLSESNVRTVFSPVFSGPLAGFKGGRTAYDAATTIFSMITKQLLDDKLTNMNLGGAILGKYDALSNCLFQQLLMKQFCGVVFVPESMMVYYAFDYRKDGVGRSIPEKLRWILTLRTTLVVAKVMASMRNAVDQKTIEIAVDEKATNLEQILDMARNIIIEKKMPRWSNDPYAVSRDIITKSLSIIPKGIKGLSESLAVAQEHRAQGAIAPEPELLDTLTEWLMTEVPPSALNQLKETDFARSVVSNNIMFSNTVRERQRVATVHNNKFVRNYLRFCSKAREEIRKILFPDGVQEAAKEAVQDGTSTSKTGVWSSDRQNELIRTIIMNVESILPPPNVSTTKAHGMELKELNDYIEMMVTALYPDNITPDSELSSVVGAIRSNVKAKLLRQALLDMGYFTSEQLPALTDVSDQEIVKMTMAIFNVKKGVDGVATLKGGGTSTETPPVSGGEPAPTGGGESPEGGELKL